MATQFHLHRALHPKRDELHRLDYHAGNAGRVSVFILIVLALAIVAGMA